MMKCPKLLLSLMTGVLMLTAYSAHADALADVQKRGVLRVAVLQDSPPYGSVTSDLKLIGLDIEVAALVAKNMGVKLETIPVTSANRIAYLQTHKADIAIATLGKNAEREKVIAFSQPYSPYNNAVFGPAALKVSGPADLAGKTIGVARGTFEDLQLTETAPPTATIKRYDDNNGMISAYVSGQVQLGGGGDFVGAALGEKLPTNKPVLKYILHESACYVGMVRDEPALLAKVNEAIAAAKKSGELNGIVQKWLHIPMPDSMTKQLQ